MDPDTTLQTLIDMGSEFPLESADDDLIAKFRELQHRGFVVIKGDMAYKTDKGRKAIVRPDLI